MKSHDDHLRDYKEAIEREYQRSGLFYPSVQKNLKNLFATFVYRKYKLRAGVK